MRPAAAADVVRATVLGTLLSASLVTLAPALAAARAVNPGWLAPQSTGARIGKPEQKTGSEGRGYGPASLLRPLSLLPRVLPTWRFR